MRQYKIFLRNRLLPFPRARSLTRPQTPGPTRLLTIELPARKTRRHSTHVRLWLKAQGSRKVRPDRRAPDPRADAIRRAAERSCRAAERSCRRRAAPAAARSFRADCDLSYLLTGVFSAPASGIFEPAAPTGGSTATTTTTS